MTCLITLLDSHLVDAIRLTGRFLAGPDAIWM